MGSTDRSFLRRNSDDIIARLNRRTLTEENISEVQDCPICMEKLQVGSEAVFLDCEHFFHPDCIITWLRMVFRF